MSNQIASNNRSDRLVFQIYNQILSLVHDRGVSRTEKLSALNISEKLGVSRTPVSFALFRLELEGLISGEEKGGWVTNLLTINDLKEIFDLKEKLFPLILSLAAQNPSPDLDEKLYIFLGEMNRSLKFKDISSWRAADKGFNHLLEMSACNQRLGYFEQILDNQLYGLLTTYLSVPSTDKSVFDIYDEIAAAISSRNAALAEEKATEFVQELRANLEVFYKEVVIPILGV
jgi:GntR family transcriptional regulator, rspAB operon transcriptional repressor